MPHLTTFISTIYLQFIPVEQYVDKFYHIVYVCTQIAFNHKSSKSLRPTTSFSDKSPHSGIGLYNINVHVLLA